MHEENIRAAFKALLESRPTRLPEGSGPVVDAFLALNRARSYGPHGPDPISWQALDAYCRVMRVPLEPHHARAVMSVDEVWMEHMLRQMKAPPEGVKTLPPISAQPLTAQLLDVVMG